MKAKRTQLYLLALALSSGTLAMTLANGWMDSQLSLARSQIPQYEAPQMASIVVAKQDIEPGTKLNPLMFEMRSWPANSMPEGAFESIEDIFDGADQRIANAPLYRKEPLLMEKLTSDKRRASLSGRLGSGLKAVSVKVNDVIGVGGFVLPGDYVDVIMTRNVRSETENGPGEETAYSFPVLRNVRVLGVDQSHDVETETPRLARTVTLEVSMRAAQKVTLASTIGRLTLVLREFEKRDAPPDPVPELVSIDDLTDDGLDKSNNIIAAVAPAPSNQAPIAPGPAVSRNASITVVRAVEVSEYTVTKDAGVKLLSMPAKR
ncbi:MAG: Flp pilus assembly protein CpaB [Pseudomonadota bacterium]